MKFNRRKKDYTLIGKSRIVKNYTVNISNKFEKIKSAEEWRIERKTKIMEKKVLTRT